MLVTVGALVPIALHLPLAISAVIQVSFNKIALEQMAFKIIGFILGHKQLYISRKFRCLSAQFFQHQND